MINIFLLFMLAATPVATDKADAVEAQPVTSIPGVVMIDGYGEVKALPDRVILDVSLYSVEKDLLDAFLANNKIATESQQLLLALKVPPENIVVTNIQVQPEYEDKDQTKFKRFRIWRNLTVILDDLQLAGKALDALLNSGAADVQLRRIYVKESEKKQYDAWKLALADIATRSRLYADKLGASYNRLEWASDSPDAYTLYRTRRSVILGKLREEAGAAMDMATLAEKQKEMAQVYNEVDGKDYGGDYYFADELTTEIPMEGEHAAKKARYAVGGKMSGRGGPAKPAAQTASTLSVVEQTFSSRFLANLVVNPARRASLGEEGMIFIAGYGVARMRLDRANLTCRVQSVGKQLQDAYTDNDMIVSAAQKGLTDLGIKPEDVATVNVSIYPEYQNEATGKIRRYRVMRDLKIKLDPMKVGDVCAALVRAGVSDIDGLSYELSDKKALEEKARQEALKDAYTRAEMIADAFGQKLGYLEWSSENPGNYPTYLFGKTNPAISYPTVQIELNEMVAYVTVYAHYTARPQ
jgi:uncharacterized protein YggE